MMSGTVTGPFVDLSDLTDEEIGRAVTAYMNASHTPGRLTPELAFRDALAKAAQRQKAD